MALSRPPPPPHPQQQQQQQHSQQQPQQVTMSYSNPPTSGTQQLPSLPNITSSSITTTASSSNNINHHHNNNINSSTHRPPMQSTNSSHAVPLHTTSVAPTKMDTPPYSSDNNNNTNNNTVINSNNTNNNTSSSTSSSSSSAAITPSLSSPPPQPEPSSVNPSNSINASKNPTSSTPLSDRQCAACERPMNGQFVRALGAVYHLDCFRCQDCNKLVANKFFPVDGIDDKQYPLCETDYFRRLHLLCAKCGTALRASYITALDKKYHVEHFTCSVCPTVFGPSDSYYEHKGDVYCHFHYSTRFAVKCTGCQTAILKQFVEIYRNNAQEHWHPECYMISKFWNVRLYPETRNTTTTQTTSTTNNTSTLNNGLNQLSLSSDQQQQQQDQQKQLEQTRSDEDRQSYIEQEATETPSSLRRKQQNMEEKVYRIWTVLSTFEESSAACISEMLRLVSSGYYYEGIDMADRFVVHVETLFACLDELAERFRHRQVREIAHIREARILCVKIVNFLSLLSQMNLNGQTGVSQALLTLVTGLAHYLKILIRIALTGALRLDRDLGDPGAMANVLARLDSLARDPVSSVVKPAATPVEEYPTFPPENPRSYGYRSIISILGRNYRTGKTVINTCDGGCNNPIDEECVRVGSRRRWHLWCLTCSKCRRCAEKRPTSFPTPPLSQEAHQARISIIKSFAVDDERRIYCSYCAPPKSRRVFEYVTRLEQFSYVLCVALYRLYNVFKEHQQQNQHQLPSDSAAVTGAHASSSAPPQIPYSAQQKLDANLPSSSSTVSVSPPRSPSAESREERRLSANIQRMRSAGLDRKLSTNERVAKRSIVVESPAGRSVQPGRVEVRQVPTRKAGPAIQNDNNNSSSAPSPAPAQNVNNNSTNVPSDATTPQSPPAVQAQAQPPSQLHQQHLQKQQQQQQQQASSRSPTLPYQPSPPAPSLTYADGPSSSAPRELEPRPTLARTTTAVRIIDDHDNNVNSNNYQNNHHHLHNHHYNQKYQQHHQQYNSNNNNNNVLAAPQQKYGDPNFSPQPSPGTPGSQHLSHNTLTLAGLPNVLANRDSRQYASNTDSPQDSANKGRFVSDLSALELFIIRHAAAYELANDPAFRDVITIEELLELIDSRKNTFWGKLFKGGGNLNKRSNTTKPGVFGVPLDILVERHGIDSMLGAGPTPVQIPTILDDMISALHQMDMSVEGVFRKNGNIRRLNEATEAIDREQPVNLQDDQPVQVAALMKKFLRAFPEPLMTFKLHELVVASQRVENPEKRKRLYHLMFCVLPKPNRDILEVLFVFLKWCASFAHVDEASGSRMDIPNLAITICPAITYARSGDPLADKSMLCVDAVREMLEWQDGFWRIPTEFEPLFEDQELFANPNELTSKFILKKAEDNQKLRRE